MFQWEISWCNLCVSVNSLSTCIVTSLSSTMTSFVRKSAPIVALYWLLNFLFTYWFISEVLPTLGKIKITRQRSETEKVTEMNQLVEHKRGCLLAVLEWAIITRLHSDYIQVSLFFTIRLLWLNVTHPESPRMMTLSSTFFLDVIVPQLQRKQSR